MHELSIVRALLARVEDEARGRRAVAVRRIRVRIGELSGVEPDLVASAYMLCRESTICRAAELDIQHVPTRWECPRCAAAIEAGAVLRCRRCNIAARLCAGDEIVIDRIEMEVA